jgi:hypothetical protein
MNTRAIVEAGRRLSLCAAVWLAACKDPQPGPAPEIPSIVPSPGQDANGADEDGTVAGSAGGAPFTRIASAFVIENPESEATTVIYLFSNPVRCLDLSFSGWDRTITKGTLVLELKLLGKTPGSFLAVSTPTPSMREAAAEWMRASADPPPIEVRSTGGWVTLDTLVARGPTTGTFALAFGRGQLTGGFKAAFCAGGHEP